VSDASGVVSADEKRLTIPEAEQFVNRKAQPMRPRPIYATIAAALAHAPGLATSRHLAR
jgi:hypothetical protein